MNRVIFQTEKKDGTFKTWKNVAIPVKYGQLLDEQLDYAVVSLVRVRRRLFKPLTRAKLTIISNTPYGGEQSNTVDYFIANDDYTENPVGSRVYNHELSLIELTKFLECFPVESLCFTTPHGNDYEIGATEPEVSGGTSGLSDWPSNKKTPSQIGTIYEINSFYDSTSVYYRNVTVTIVNSNGTTSYYSQSGNFYGKYFTIVEGQNTITYSGKETTILSSGAAVTGDFTKSYSITGVPQRLPAAPWTEEDVTKRLLDLVEPLRRGQTPRFTLNTENKAVFQNLAPEYTFTRMNLRECLQMQGGRIHGEPRLKINDQNQNEISFDWYGGREYAKITNYKTRRRRNLNTYKHTTNKGNWDIEQAANQMESYMDNLVNRVDYDKATLGQPLESDGTRYLSESGQTFRTETYDRMKDDNNTFFPTQFPIDTPVKLEVGIWDPNMNDGEGGHNFHDITAFLYEKKVYDNLSSYKAQAPAKSVSLYYSQGEKNIMGLFFQSPSVIEGFNNYAIINVVKFATGVDISGYNPFSQIVMRFTYVPIYSTRVSHGKQYLNDYLHRPRTLNYSQSDNSVESRYFGQNIKSTVQRLGNVEKYCTFVLRNVSNIPRAGQLWDDENYISTVNVSVGQYLIHVTVGLSKHFNRKSSYIGANSYKRIYEVSEVQVQSRHSLYKDYIVISAPEGYNYTGTPGKALLSYSGFADATAGIFNESAVSQYDEISAAIVTMTTKNDAVISNVILPVMSSSFGNTMEFTWEFEDNYSAGLSTEEVNTGTINAVYGIGTQYCDNHGRAYYMYFNLGGKDRPLDRYWYDPNTFPQYNQTADRKRLCGVEYGTEEPIVLRKDSREALRMSYVLEYVAETYDIIIGEALTSSCPLVSFAGKYPHLYVLDRTIGPFEDKLTQADIDSAEELGVVECSVEADFSDPRNPKYAKLNGATATKEGKSWVYAYPIVEGEGKKVENEDGEEITIRLNKGGDILLARNVNVSAGDKAGVCYMTLVHDIYEYMKLKDL